MPREFESFLEIQVVKHSLSAPYHPATNGLAERAVQTVKQGVTRQRRDRDLRDRLSKKPPKPEGKCTATETRVPDLNQAVMEQEKEYTDHSVQQTNQSTNDQETAKKSDTIEAPSPSETIPRRSGRV